MPTMTINLTLPVDITKEGDVFVAICPTLNVASQGCTTEEALLNIKEAIDLFITTCMEMGTISQVLRECGFTKVDEKQNISQCCSRQIDVVLPYIAKPKTSECHA